MPALKILLDECIDRRFAQKIPGHSATTVPDAGWAGLSNGELLSKSQEQFDVFITVDQSLPKQQNLSKYKIAVIVLSGTTNRLDDLLPFVPGILKSLEKTLSGQVIILSL